MTRDNLLFSIIGVLLGFILGFMLASTINRREAIPVTGGRTQNLPADHPQVGDAQSGNPGAMQPQVLAALDKARKEPNNFDAQVAAAQMYMQIQRYDDGIAYLMKANQLKPDDVRPIGYLAIANMDAGHFETAEKWYKLALLKEPKNETLLDGYCSVLLQEGNAKDAADAIAKLAQVAPNNEDLPQFREQLAKLNSGKK